jgi:hypothetical protein
MSVTPTEDALIVALDFEGRSDCSHSYRDLIHRGNCRR